MSKFDINVNRVKGLAEDEKNISNQIDGIRSQLTGILNSLHIQSAAADSIRRKLASGIDDVTDNQKKIAGLAAALLDISNLYEKTERDIIGHGNPVANGIKDAIDNVKESLLNLGRGVGLFPPACYSKDPVNLSNGNYVYEKNCIMLNGETELTFDIFYNNQGRSKSCLGSGWVHSWNIYLEIDEQTIRLHRGDDSSSEFEILNDGSIEAVPGSRGTLSQNDSGYMFFDADTDRYFFNEKGILLRKENLAGMFIDCHYDESMKLIKIESRRGDFLELSYEEEKLIKVEDSAGRKIIFDWSADRLAGFVDAMGAKTQYEYDDRGNLCKITNPNGYCCLINEFDELGRTSLQRFADGGVVRYNYENDRVEMIEQNGKKTVYIHDELLRNVKTVHENGEETYTYDDNHNRTSYTDRNGNVFRYLYNNHKLTNVTTPLGDQISYQYNALNQLLSFSVNGTVLNSMNYNTNNQIKETSNAFGVVETYDYNNEGMMVEKKTADGAVVSVKYDDRGNIVELTNPLGGKTSFEYNAAHQVIKATDPLGNVNEFEYDDAGRIIRAKDAVGHCKSYRYDGCGNLTGVTDYNGTTIEARYNSVNKIASIKDAENRETKYSYDHMFNLIKVENPDGSVLSYEYDDENRLVRLTDARGFSNILEYDACGNLIKRTDPNGGVHEIGYDALNRANYVKDPAGAETRAKFDALGNVTEILFSDGTKESYTYDVMGNLSSSTDAMGYTKSYKYDILGNLTEVYDETGWLSKFAYYPGGLLKKEELVNGKFRSYTYNENEQVIGIEDENGLCICVEYDSMGNAVKISKNDGSVEEYTYDALGNITSYTDGEGNKSAYTYNQTGMIDSVTDAMGAKTEYSYDKMSRLCRINRGGGHITEYKRDPNGNITSIVSPDHSEVLLGYDGCNRLISKTLQDGSNMDIDYYPDGNFMKLSFSDNRAVVYSYDSLKRLVQLEDWMGKTSISRDANGRVTRVVDPQMNEVTYQWNQRGDLANIIYPDNESVFYEYTDDTNLSSVSYNQNKISYFYNGSKKLAKKTFNESYHVSYEYGLDGKLKSQKYMHADDILESTSYLYDKNGRKTAQIREKNGQTFREDYEYTAGGSLSKVLRNGKMVQSYNYDLFGNRISSEIDGVARRYKYDDMDHLLEINEPDGIRSYEYDKCGNLLLEKLNDKNIRKTSYNAMGLLSDVWFDNKNTHYDYNGFGYRTDADTDGSRAHFVYDLVKDYNNLLCVSDKATRNIIWDHETIGTSCGGTDTFLFNDDGMTPKAGVGINGVEWFDAPDPFGNMDVLQNGYTLGFVGYRMEQNTGLYYVNAREYDPKTGRFISRDPLEGECYTPSTMNKYTYANADPINMYDPLGLFFAGLVVGAVKAVANVAVKAAGDIVNTAVASVKNGKFTPKVSSWESYVGTATGGFVEGTVFVATGGNMMLASAAGSATETFVTNGLSMLAGEEGFRKEDGYTVGSLLKDTAVSGVEGAVTGATIGSLFKDPKIKIPGITKGKGSWLSVSKGLVTKATNGTIKNISAKSLGKMLGVFGGVSLIDNILDKGKKKIKEEFKDFVQKKAVDPLRDRIMAFLGDNSMSAACPTEAA